MRPGTSYTPPAVLLQAYVSLSKLDTARVWSAANSGVVQHTDQGVGQGWRGRRGARCDDEHAQCTAAARHHQLGWSAACPRQSCTAWQVSVLLCPATAYLPFYAACMSDIVHPVGCTGHLVLLDFALEIYVFEDASTAEC